MYYEGQRKFAVIFLLINWENSLNWIQLFLNGGRLGDQIKLFIFYLNIINVLIKKCDSLSPAKITFYDIS